MIKLLRYKIWSSSFVNFSNSFTLLNLWLDSLNFLFHIWYHYYFYLLARPLFLFVCHVTDDCVDWRKKSWTTTKRSICVSSLLFDCSIGIVRPLRMIRSTFSAESSACLRIIYGSNLRLQLKWIDLLSDFSTSMHFSSSFDPRELLLFFSPLFNVTHYLDRWNFMVLSFLHHSIDWHRSIWFRIAPNEIFYASFD